VNSFTTLEVRELGGADKRGYMLYDTYQVHSDVLAPIRLMAECFRGVLTQPWPLIEDAPIVRGAAAAMELLSNPGCRMTGRISALAR
jgi:poly-beta-hydroxyalkanoate depolymerase